MIKLFAITIFLIAGKAYSFQDQLSLRGGANVVRGLIETFDERIDIPESEDDFKGFGFNTHFGYKWKDWELLGSSYNYFGKVEHISLLVSNKIITGSGSYRHLGIGPLLRYHTPYEPFKSWLLYLGAGPSWSLQTIKMKDFTTNGNFNRDQKLTYESFGYTLSLGIEENLKYKNLHPVYFELVYSFKKSFKVSTVDASDFTETNILTSEETQQEIQSKTIYLSMGIVIF